MNLFVKLVIFVVLFITAERLCHKATNGFTVQTILKPLKPSEKKVELDPEILKILNKPFYFLDNGGQCYAFLSEDGNYVLKVFKHYRIELPKFVEPFAPQSTKDFFARKKAALLLSCSISANELAEETATLLSHLENSPDFPSYMTLVDKLNIAHVIPTDQLPFMVQKRVVILQEHFANLLQSGDRDAAKASIDSLAELVKKRCQKGIADHDPAIWRNFGFIGNQAIEIDIGSYFYDPSLKKPSRMRRELFFELSNFRSYFSSHYPELAPYFSPHIEALLETPGHSF